MGWLGRWAGRDAALPQLKGRNVLLRPPMPQDFDQWRTLRDESRAFLVPWEPAWAPDELSRQSYRMRLRINRAALADGTAQPFFIFTADGKTLLGGINITNIRRGVAQMGTLGYWMGEKHAGKGLMAEALAAVILHARDELRLHRLEAACIPSNTPSVRLLTRMKFENEGLARAYLRINGRWEDHLLWGRVL